MTCTVNDSLGRERAGKGSVDLMNDLEQCSHMIYSIFLGARSPFELSESNPGVYHIANSTHLHVRRIISFTHPKLMIVHRIICCFEVTAGFLRPHTHTHTQGGREPLNTMGHAPSTSSL